jgi:catechol 2,3-dioxygenase-like lactoylglutathione lyase family enzyme
MLLRDAPVAAILPTTDIERAKRFYTETLGLQFADVDAPATIAFECGNGTMLVVYEREGGTNADHTVAGWMVDDVEKVVGELHEKGIVFEQYDMPNLKTDERGIAELGGALAAWFKDPDGNILSITEEAH